MNKTIQVYVSLLEEGTPTIRPTLAEELGNNLYKLLPTPDYDSEDEVWEFVPGSIVKVISILTDKGKSVFLATEIG